MKKLKSAVLSLGNENSVKVEIRTNKDLGLFFLFVGSKKAAISEKLSAIKCMFDSWFYATEEQRREAIKPFENEVKSEQWEEDYKKCL
jgi:hypothetical protein